MAEIPEPKESFWDKARKRIANSAKEIPTAVNTYKAWGNYLIKGKVTSISGNQLINDRERLVNIFRRDQVGRMAMFFYDPKHGNKLPYFDRFPLVIVMELYNDGFLGLNLHYLPPLSRAKLLDSIINIYDDAYMDENRKLMYSYNIMRAYSRSKLYEPCVKRYLYSHCRSKYYMVRPEDWHIAVLLPTERFMKAPKTRVFAESMIKVKR